MNKIDSNLFYNARSTGLIKDSFRLTNEAKILAFNLSNSGVFPSINLGAFLAIEACFYSLAGIRDTDMSNSLYAGACDASTPWAICSDEAALYPEQCQPWEVDNEAFMDELNGVYTLTYQGEIAFNNYLKEADKLLIRRSMDFD